MRRLAALAMLMLATVGASGGETYYFTPDATAQTKADVAAGRPPDKGFPAILDVHWSTTRVRPNTTLDGVVTTSTNINYVGGKYLSWTMRFDQVGPGQFHIRYKVPALPPFMLGRWTVDIVARTSDGVEVRSPSTLSYSYW